MPGTVRRHRPDRRLGRSLVAVVVGAALTLTGCARVVDGTGHTGVADAHLKVIGGTSEPFDITAENALSDIEKFWTMEYPKVSGGKPLPKLRGGLYSVDGLAAIENGQVPDSVRNEACIRKGSSSDAVDAVVDNAFYCPLDDSVVWDRAPKHLIAALGKTYGSLLVAAVFAHEFGHAIQERLGIFAKKLPTIDTESQADCASGAFLGWALAGNAPHFKATASELDRALRGYTLLRDQTPGSSADLSHGNAFDRLSAVSDGIAHGATYCYSATYFNRQFTERPYVSDQDYADNGNEPLAAVLDARPPNKKGTGGGGVVQDLNAYWKQAAQQRGKTWTPLTIAAADEPPCDTGGTARIGYCSDHTVYYQRAYATKAYYSLDTVSVNRQNGDVSILRNQAADFALDTMLAIGWGISAQTQLGQTARSAREQLSWAVCSVGAYAKTINVTAVPKGRFIVLSPPDMDEGTSALLNLIGPASYGTRGTTGLQRVQAFVAGYNGGLAAC